MQDDDQQRSERPLPTLRTAPAASIPTHMSIPEPSPPLFILIPLLSISPAALVSLVPQYCATYNSLVWQYSQLAKIVRTRTKPEDHKRVLGEVEREEVRVVPLGNVEAEMAAKVGLRRVACLGIKVRFMALPCSQLDLPVEFATFRDQCG